MLFPSFFTRLSCLFLDVILSYLPTALLFSLCPLLYFLFDVSMFLGCSSFHFGELVHSD